MPRRTLKNPAQHQPLVEESTAGCEPVVNLVTPNGFTPVDLAPSVDVASSSTEAAAPGDCTDPNNFIAADDANGFVCTSRVTVGAKGHLPTQIHPKQVFVGLP